MNDELPNRTKSTTKRSMPAILPIFAITSAKSFNLSCKGVFSESQRNATSHCLVREHKCKSDKGRTHYATPVETFWPNSDDQVSKYDLPVAPDSSHCTL